MTNNLVLNENMQRIYVYLSLRVSTKCYTQEYSPVFTCFLDASKAFDKINHYTLILKLLNRETPIMLVRILLFWYTIQTMCVKWRNCMFDYFYVSNGVRQGGILSPKLFSVYLDDLFVSRSPRSI